MQMEFLNGYFTQQNFVLLFIQSSPFSAMVHSGIGERQINNLLSTLNIPAVCHKTLLRREEIGAAVNFVAQDSTERALKEEIDLTEKYDHNTFLVHRVNQLAFHFKFFCYFIYDVTKISCSICKKGI